MRKINPLDLVAVLLALLALLLAMVIAVDLDKAFVASLRGTPAETQMPTEEPTAPATEAPATEPTEPPTEMPTEAPTEPQPERFVLTFVGDCTFGCNVNMENAKSAFPLTVGEDYGYPFRNVLEYFQNDDYSLINLEGVLGDQGKAKYKKYVFRGSGAYTQILTENSIEGVTLANNHAGDYGEEGYAETKRLLEEAGIDYVEHNASAVVTTQRGLTIALYGMDNAGNALEPEEIEAAMTADIAALKGTGADLVICAFHWGRENTFEPTSAQQELGHAAIDAGADIVWGHHPHVLQPIEYYKDGVIYYSLGNFAFGGNSAPKDLDTVLLQQEVIRDVDGTVTLGELTRIPCSVSSVGGHNNFQPTPYDVDSKAYDRVLRKLDNSYLGSNLPVG